MTIAIIFLILGGLLIFEIKISGPSNTWLQKQAPIFPKAIVCEKQQSYLLCKTIKLQKYTSVHSSSGVFYYKVKISDRNNTVQKGGFVWFTPTKNTRKGVLLEATTSIETEYSFGKKLSSLIL